jgi:hypothetical protein
MLAVSALLLKTVGAKARIRVSIGLSHRGTGPTPKEKSNQSKDSPDTLNLIKKTQKRKVYHIRHIA